MAYWLIPGSFCLAFGASMTPAFNSAGTGYIPCSFAIYGRWSQIPIAPYSPTTTDTVAGLHSPGFVNTFGMCCFTTWTSFSGSHFGSTAFFFLFMAVLMFIYMICATRINMVFVGIFAGLILVFSLLAAAYWRLGLGDAIIGNRLTVVSFVGLVFSFMNLLGGLLTS